MVIRALAFAALFCMTAPSMSQVCVDSSMYGRIITRIEIRGNNKTKQSIILREMKLKQGSVLDSTRLEGDRKRIENLLVFNRVQVTGLSENNGIALVIQVSEQIYFVPFPVLFINDRDWSKVSWGAGFIHSNFLGRTEKLAGIFWTGYDPAVHLAYSNPWIGKKYNLLTKIELFYARIKNKHYADQTVYEYQKGFKWDIGRRWGHHFYGQISLGYRLLDITEPDTVTRTDRLPSAGVNVLYDRRDLVEFPLSGYYVNLHFKNTGFDNSGPMYQRITFDCRSYLPVSRRSSLAFRGEATVSAGSMPLYDRLYIGYSNRVRGHFSDVFEGDMLAMASAGYRFPLLDIRYFNITSLPQFHNMKFGIYGSVFFDYGAVWFKDRGFAQGEHVSGAGIGLNIILPYVHVMRIDLAWDEQGSPEIIFDIGVDI